MAPESTEAAPESVSIDQAVAMMASLEGEDTADDTVAAGEAAAGEATADADVQAGAEDNAGTASEDGAGEDNEQPVESEGEAEAAASEEAPAVDAPEFWSAEDKALWATLPPAALPVIHKYEAQRNETINEKMREAAKIRQDAQEAAREATQTRDEAAKWWQANAEQFFRAFGDKWAGVDWNKLSEDDPAQWARLKQQRDNEAALLRQAHERGQADIEASNKRAAERLQEAKRAEHDKLVRKHPEFFGTNEKATKTYKDLGQFLLDNGFTADRINAVHEAPMIEIVLDAMRYRQAKTQASTVAKPGAANTPAKQTPQQRIAPGPANNAGNPSSQRARQAGERVRSGRSLSVGEAAATASALNLFG